MKKSDEELTVSSSPAYRLATIPAASVVPRTVANLGLSRDYRRISHAFIDLASIRDRLAADLDEQRKLHALLERQRREDLHRLARAETGRRTMEAHGVALSERVRLALRANADLGDALDVAQRRVMELEAAGAEAQARDNEMEQQLAKLRRALTLSHEEAQAERAQCRLLMEEAAALRDDVAGYRSLPQPIRRASPVDEDEMARRLDAGVHHMPADVRLALGGSIVRRVLLRAWRWVTLRLARRAARRDYWPVAERMYEALLTTKRSTALWKQLGNVRQEQGLARHALNAYQEARDRDPGDEETGCLIEAIRHAGPREGEPPCLPR